MIGFTALDFVWEAPIVGTGDRVKADGVWTGAFATEEEMSVENIIFQPVLTRHMRLPLFLIPER